MVNVILKPKKRLGRMRRGRKLGIIIPLKGEKVANKNKGKVKKFKE